MLSEEVIDKVVERLVRRIEQGNEYVLQEMGKSVRRIGTLSPSKAQELVQMLKYGGDYDKIVKKLAEITNTNVKEIYKIFNEIAKKDYEFAEQFYKYRNKPYIPYEQNTALKRQVEAIARITAEEYLNISQTMAFARKVGKRVIYTDLARTYQDLMDQAILNVGQGKETFDSAMKRTLKQLGNSGLRTVDGEKKVDYYKSGTSRRLDSAVRMNLKGGITHLHEEIQKQIGEEIDSDGVEISVHNNPAPDHADAQGKQFKIKEYEKLQETGHARSYDKEEINLHRHRIRTNDEALEFRPIGEYNCYHYTFAIVLGVSEPNYSNKELKEIKEKNEKGFEYNGKHYTMYEGTQLQRQLETRIRKQKDIQIMAVAEDNKELILESQKKITELNHEYKKLNKASGLSEYKERMKVSGYQRKKVDLDKTLKVENTSLQNGLQYGNVIIPLRSKMDNVVVIAGYGTKTPIKEKDRLNKEYPDLPQTWQKKTGQIKSNYNDYEIHWYENSGKQYEQKIKRGKQK